MSNTPSKGDLRARLVVLLADGNQRWVLHELSKVFTLGVDGVLVPEWRVLCEVNTLRLVPLIEALLLEPWVELELVCCWDLYGQVRSDSRRSLQ